MSPPVLEISIDCFIVSQVWVVMISLAAHKPEQQALPFLQIKLKILTKTLAFFLMRL
jgi:hypothetical protein